MKTKCELCKCLNLITEGKKNPSQTVWNNLQIKWKLIREKNPKSINSFCEKHRIPLVLNNDLISVLKKMESLKINKNY